MPAVTLPLTFANSFWTQDYRRGLEILYGKLEQGIDENDEIIALIKARVAAEKSLADSLTYPAPTGPGGSGFGEDEGASLLVAFRGIQAESVAQGEVHRSISRELETLVVDPFESWAHGHKERVYNSRKNVVDGWLKAYELAQGDTDKLKHAYLFKVRKADEAEDDVKFAPNNEFKDKFTASPRMHPRDSHPRRSASVSERIAQRIKDIQGKNPLKSSVSGMSIFEDKTTLEESQEEEKLLPSVDKGKGKAETETETDEEFRVSGTLASPPELTLSLPSTNLGVKSPTSPMPPPPPSPILLAGLALPPSAVSDLLARASGELPLRPIKVPILGEYQDCFSGEEFVTWLKESVQGFGDSWDRAEAAARDLTEQEGVLRRVGEFGNKFEASDDAFYQFRPKAFTLHAEYTKQSDSLTGPTVAGLAPLADNFVKRSGTLLRNVSKAINNTNNAGPLHIRAREEAEAANKRYRIAIRKLDRQRLGLEEKIEDTLKVLQKMESDRLNAVKTVLLQYQGTLANLPAALQPSLDRSANLIASYQPESDQKALIERYRTGPFRPNPQIYESVSHDEFDVVFGIDLRKWAEGGWLGVRSGEDKKDKIPEVVTVLLAGLTEAYQRLPNDLEKRRAWIYEVPLQAVHHLRESINAVSFGKAIPPELLAKYDAPVLASTFKLWMLELNPPLGLWEGWDDIRRLYPSVGAPKTNEGDDTKQVTQDLIAALQRLPKVHLLVLEAFFQHLKTLIDTTTVDESDDVYITKLALSLGRAILRPKYETEISIQDRHPTMLFIDLFTHFDEIIPPTIIKKKRESDRRMPIKKRTAPIDMRVSRSKLSVDADAQDILEAQLAAKNPNYKPVSRNASPSGERTSVPPPPEPVPVVQPPQLSSVVETPVEPIPTVTANVPEPFYEPIIPEPVPVVAPTIPEPATLNDGDRTPPRPFFKEPPPETDDFNPPPMPRFVDPPPENGGIAVEAPSAPVIISPPTPLQKPASAADRLGTMRTPSPSPVRSRLGSRAGSPITPVSANDDRPGANLSRSSSGEASRIRGSRGARSPRTSSISITGVISGSNSPGGNGGSGTKLARSSLNRPSSVVNPQDYEPRRKGGRAQAGAFSRRTMASDAEDEVVEK